MHGTRNIEVSDAAPHDFYGQVNVNIASNAFTLTRITMLQQVQQNTIQRTLQHCILRLLSKIAGRWGLLLDTLDVTCLSYSSHDTAISVIVRHDTHGVSIRVKHATLARPHARHSVPLSVAAMLFGSEVRLYANRATRSTLELL